MRRRYHFGCDVFQSRNDGIETRRRVIEAAARALFVQWYASEQEQREQDGKSANVAGAGQDWMDVAPSTPRKAFRAACDLIESVERLNGRDIYALLASAARADGCAGDAYRNTSNEDDFGHYLAMEAVGHGVSWFDNHARFEIKLPHVEYY